MHTKLKSSKPLLWESYTIHLEKTTFTVCIVRLRLSIDRVYSGSKVNKTYTPIHVAKSLQPEVMTPLFACISYTTRFVAFIGLFTSIYEVRPHTGGDTAVNSIDVRCSFVDLCHSGRKTAKLLMNKFFQINTCRFIFVLIFHVDSLVTSEFSD